MAYVYMGTSHTSDEWYVGYRSSPTVDLGVTYFTSSKIVKPRFTEFSWIILGEFENPKDAYDMEQEYIHILREEPGRLNRVCHYGKKRFSTGGKPLSDVTKKKISEANTGKIYAPKSEETRKKLSEAHKERHSLKSLERKCLNQIREKFTVPDQKKLERNCQRPLRVNPSQKPTARRCPNLSKHFQGFVGLGIEKKCS